MELSTLYQKYPNSSRPYINKRALLLYHKFQYNEMENKLKLEHIQEIFVTNMLKWSHGRLE